MRTRCPVLIVNDTRVDGHHGCTAVMTALERLLEAHGFVISARWSAHTDWRGDPGFAHALAGARLVVVNGEGTIHHDRPAGRRLVELGAAARAEGVPSALINTGWEANGEDLAAMLVDFALLAARDERSAAAMRTGASTVRVVPDLSLCTDPPPSSRSRQGLGISDNVDRLRALDLADLRRAVGGRWLSIHHRRPLLGFLRSGLSLREDVFHPMRLAGLLAQRYGIWRASQDDLERFLAELGGLQLLVSGRFHACTLALLTGTPFVAQASNTGKIAALIADAGLDPARAALPAEPADLRDLARQGWTLAEEAARRAYLDQARSRAAVLAADLRALAS